MNEIVCPHCDKVFNVDETSYAHILKQVRDHEFDKQLNERMKLAEREKVSALKVAAKESEIEIERLKSEIRHKEDSAKTAVKLAQNEIMNERDSLKQKKDILSNGTERQKKIFKDTFAPEFRDVMAGRNKAAHAPRERSVTLLKRDIRRLKPKVSKLFEISSELIDGG